MSKTQIMQIQGWEVNYINDTSNKIDEHQLLEQLECGDKSGTLYMNGFIIPIGTWWIVDWKEIASVLYDGYKGMINGVPWTEEGVKRVDEAIKAYEQNKMP